MGLPSHQPADLRKEVIAAASERGDKETRDRQEGLESNYRGINKC